MEFLDMYINVLMFLIKFGKGVAIISNIRALFSPFPFSLYLCLSAWQGPSKL